MDTVCPIRIAHSPDPDDAFMFHALTTNAFDTVPYTYTHVLDDIETLNQQALAGEFEVTAVSIHALPEVLDRYALMNCGGSMGEGYGPIIVARAPMTSEQLIGCRIAIPGEKTSAHLALKIAYGDLDTVVVPFDRIIDTVIAGDVDAGLLIHEGQLTWADHRLHLVADLGAWWQDRWGLPLPLGCNVVRRDLGQEACRIITEHVRRSIEHGLAHPEAALTFAKRWGRGIDDETNRKFVEMYVNPRTIDYGAEGRRAIRLFLREGQRVGMISLELDVESLLFIGQPGDR